MSAPARQVKADIDSPETGNDALRPRELARAAKRMFQSGPLGLRVLQHLRPFICPFEEVIKWVPPGSHVLDVGCGGGLLLGLLHHAGRLEKGVGFDLSADAIKIARQMVEVVGVDAGRVLNFEAIGVEDPWPAGPFDVVTIVDVMHHVPLAARRRVLELAADRLRPGGRLVYKDMTHRGWRAFMNRLHDLTLTREWIRYTPAAVVEGWAAELELRLVQSSCHRRWWYGHDLRVMEKVER